MVLELVNITKRFGNHTALDGINLQVKAGEIHGLAGLNGSGKSTLLNILFGSRIITDTRGFSGSYLLDGKPCRFSQPCQAVQCGIGMVHQEQALIPDLNSTENILINREPVHRFSRVFPRSLSPINTKKAYHLAKNTLAGMGIGDPGTKAVSALALNIRQFIEIARELSRGDLKLLLLDEPTSVFSKTDVVRLQKTLRELADRGVAIIFVSHRLDELVSTCDNATILCDGKVTARLHGKELTPAAITAAMIPHDIVQTRKNPAQHHSLPKLRIRDFRVPMTGEELTGVDLSISQSEIIGLTGLSGSGRNSLGYGIMGLCPSSGTIEMDGKKLPVSSPAQMLKTGFFFLPEERQKMGLLLNHSIAENIVFSPMHVAGGFSKAGRLLNRVFPDNSGISRHAEQCVADFSIGCRSTRQKVSELSGGNQQKVCLAHALTLAPGILFINEPTRGVDIAAKEMILGQIISTCRRHGTTVIISSSELDELRRICDRIGVLFKGKLQAIFPPETSEAEFASAMLGEWRAAS